MGAIYNSLRDPIDNSITSLYHWRSYNSTWNSATITNSSEIFDYITIPTSANFPNSTASRYMLNLPGEIYFDGITSSTLPFYIKNENTSTILTRRDITQSLIANTYKVFPSTSIGASRIEIHVASSNSNSPGDRLVWDGYFVNTILQACQTEIPIGQVVLGTTNSVKKGMIDRIIFSSECAGEIINSYITNLSNGGKIVLLDGTFNINTTGIEIAQNNINIEGMGKATIINNNTTTITYIISLSSNYEEIYLSNFNIVSNVFSASAITGVYCPGSSNSVLPTATSNYNFRKIGFSNISISGLFSTVASYGFYYAQNIEKCFVEDSNSSVYTTIQGFLNCQNISKSYVKDIYRSSAGDSYGFVNCNNLKDCIAQDLYGLSSYSKGFSGCFDLTGCVSLRITSISALTTNTTSKGYGFFQCWSIQNSQAAYCGTDGFNDSDFLVMNYSKFNGSSNSSAGYGYNACTRMMNNRASDNYTTGALNSFAGNSSNAVALTATGGYNDM